MLAFLLFRCISVVLLAQGALAKHGGHKKPNFVYISDDQSVDLSAPEFMPNVHKHITQYGTNFTSYFTPMTNCCPSRAGFFRSQHGHQHNITWVAEPFGGWERFVQLGYHLDWLPVWLQQAGYQTYYSGKLMNRNTVRNAETFPVTGFNASDLFLDPYTYMYYNVSVSHQSGPAKSYTGQYSTELLQKFALGHLETISKHSDEPFFIGIAPIGPHSTTNVTDGDYKFEAPEVENKYYDWYSNNTNPRVESFNADEPSGASWLRDLPKLNATEIEYVDNWYRRRLQATKSVDDLVGAVVEKVEELGLTDNTYIIYSGDNGYTIGRHRRQPGKTTLYDEDVRIPLVIRGPGIKAGAVETEGSFLNIDLAATINHLAGGQPGHQLDGRIMPFGYHKEQQTGFPFTLTEYWYLGEEEGKYYRPEGMSNNTYRGLRVREGEYDLAYHIWCTGERELFNMTADPYQMHNMLQDLNDAGQFTQFNVNGTYAEALAARLDGALLWMKSCRGDGCHDPWPYMFPFGEVKSFAEAMQPEFSEYFQYLPRVEYSECQIGFHPFNEYPMWDTELSFWNGPFYTGGNATTHMAGGLTGVAKA